MHRYLPRQILAALLCLALPNFCSADELDTRELFARAQQAALQSKHDESVKVCEEILKLDPKFAPAFQLRGEEQFKRSKFHESVVDFQSYLKLVPAAEPGHWQLGISYYYDGQYAAGAKQFEAYQNVDENDVENVVWRFLCQARDVGVEKARAAMFKVKQDRRVPMMEVIAMFRGDLKPEEVLQAAEVGKPSEDELKTRRFNANLYVGLYYAALGKPELASKHISAAHDKYAISHYMDDVARVHAALLKVALEAKIPPGLKEYQGREIAQTMHYLGAPWLTRESREREEDCTTLLQALQVKPGMTVCDMGCGNGFYTLKLAEMVGAKGQVLAVDIQQEMLHLLEERAKAAELTNIKPLLGSVIDPQLPENSVDLLFCVDVYHEFSHPEQMLQAMRKSLSPKGRLALVEFRLEDPKVPIKTLHKMSKEQILKEFTPNGFKLVEEFDKLPWQHVMFFERAEPAETKPTPQPEKP